MNNDLLHPRRIIKLRQGDRQQLGMRLLQVLLHQTRRNMYTTVRLQMGTSRRSQSRTV